MNENYVINQAITILQSRLRKPIRTFENPDDTFRYLKLLMAELEYESFRVLYLDSQHRLIEDSEMFRGTIDAAAVYPREVVKAALHFNAAAVIFAHNHPSGVAKPSEADHQITQRLKEALSLVGIRTLDHVIVGSDEPYSFARSCTL